MDWPTYCHQRMTNSMYAVLTLNGPLNRRHSDADMLGNHFHYTKSTIEMHVSFLIHFTLNRFLLCWHCHSLDMELTKLELYNVAHSISTKIEFLHKYDISQMKCAWNFHKTMSTTMVYISISTKSVAILHGTFGITAHTHIAIHHPFHSIHLRNLFNWHNSTDKIF